MEHNPLRHDGHGLLPRRKRPRKKLVLQIVIPVGAVLLIILGLSIQPALALARSAMAGKTHFLAAKEHLTAQRFSKAHDELAAALANFGDAQRAVNRLTLLRFVPLVSRQVSTVEKLIQLGTETGTAASALTETAVAVTEPLNRDGASFDSISAEEKRALLERLAAANADIRSSVGQFSQAASIVDSLPRHFLVPALAKAVQELRSVIPEVREQLETALPILDIMPAVLGYPTERSYLFLLQNNNELRPTGGFIGTYGILRVRDGEVLSLETDNIYNLDNPARSLPALEPPEPLRRYLKANKWFLRDGNWSPDFPTTARQALSMYDRETQSRNSFEGVIAMTPTVLQELLRVSGPLTVQGKEFAADTVVDELENYVGRDFVAEGVSDADRKDIIGALGQKLFTTLLSLPKERWSQFFTATGTMLSQKQLLFYFTDEKEENLVRSLNWAGAIPQDLIGDSLLVVDANMASLKSDQKIARTISYSVAMDGDALRASLSVTYNNTGSFDWKTTRYRTYVRVYVPKGSALVGSTGFLTDDKLHGGRAKDAVASEELERTVFSGFTAIEPGEEGTITLTYTLPQSVLERFKSGTYELYAQKQAGTLGHAFALDIDTGGRVQSCSPSDRAEAKGEHCTLVTDLSVDRSVSAIFSP